MAFDPIVVVDAVYGAAAVGLGVIVAIGGRGARRWLLLLYLALMGLNALAAAPAGALGWQRNVFVAAAGHWSFWVLGLACLPFVGAAVPSPLARPFRAPAFRYAAIGAIAFVIVATALAPELFFERDATDPARWQFVGPSATLSHVGQAMVVSVLPYAVAAAAHAVMRAPAGSPERRRALAYAWAFGLHDLGVAGIWAIGYVTGAALTLPQYAGTTAVALVGLALLARALLREQLFDFDLKLKWTLRRGTLVGVFLAAFFIVAAIVEQWLQQYGVLVGGVAVGAMLFALRPIERAADRLANAAMPNVQDTQEYRMVRKREVYRAAVESALEDGEVTEKERNVLATLADQLGLGVKETLEIEREARGRPSPS